MKKLIIIVIIIFALFILFTLLFGKSNVAIVSDTLIDNNYVLDGDVYRKKVTNNTQEDFYNNMKNNVKEEYVEYQYIINTNTLKSINLKFDSLYYLCDITEELSSNKLKYSCNSSYNDLQLNIYGDFDYNNYELSCGNRNANIDDNVTSEYCDNVSNQIKDFILERNKLLMNKDFKNAVSKN